MKPLDSSPQDILAAELRSTAKISARVRYLLNKRLDHIKRLMKDPNIREEQMSVLSEELIGIASAMSNATDKVARIILSPKAPTVGADGMDTDKIMEELVKGRPKKS